MIVINIGIVILIALLVLVISSCVLKLEPKPRWAVIINARNYLISGPVSLAFAAVIVAVEVIVALTGTKEQIISNFGLPNNNFGAYFVYAFLHVDSMHLLENAGSLLICGGIVESSIRSRWFLILVASIVPFGGFLATLAAPVFIDSPWTGGAPSVGFSIVVYAILVMCLIFVIEFLLKERLIKLACERWKRLSAAAIVLLYFLSSFITGVHDSPGESILGHCIGMALGLAAVTIYCLERRIRRQVTA